MFILGLFSALLFAFWIFIWPINKKIKKPKEKSFSGLKIKRNDEKKLITPRKNLTIYEFFKEN